MENATKALEMAGGVLIAIMVLATLLYAASTWGIIPKAKEDQEKIKQVSEFNMQFESYMKNALYGSDLATLLNKARDNNERYGANPGERGYIDIQFTISSIDGYENVIRYYEDSKTHALIGPYIESEKIIKGISAGTYNLASSAVDKIFDGFASGSRYTISNKNWHYDRDTGEKYQEYTEKRIDVSEFKTRVFECIESQTRYDEDGRITFLVFKERDISSLIN